VLAIGHYPDLRRAWGGTAVGGGVYDIWWRLRAVVKARSMRHEHSSHPVVIASSRAYLARLILDATQVERGTP
jgi:hypothetical protein